MVNINFLDEESKVSEVELLSYYRGAWVTGEFGVNEGKDNFCSDEWIHDAYIPKNSIVKLVDMGTKGYIMLVLSPKNDDISVYLFTVKQGNSIMVKNLKQYYMDSLEANFEEE